ncbi:hypothetical protein [Streptomyces sp. NBC_00102]|uniref:hypothetical protein n=1 Tax=Streptomyces sp. NBC_00102 TaxID=2975652 RepID=UPI002256C4F8|nr:hypothetical protein [Streptomyces sp. NBC_00102]MCX5402318.1 hypothetical protein [Streptomyces sp. NBC_00102]
MAAVPALSALKRQTEKKIDFDLIESRLGVRIPGDFKEIASWFPSLQFDEYLRIPVPIEGGELEYFDAMAYDLDTLAGLGKDGLAGGWLPHPMHGGLIPWGDSIDGDSFYWRVNDPDPEIWTVVVGGANDSWWEVQCGMTEFVIGLIEETCDSGEIPEGVIVSSSPVHELTY